MIVDFDHVDMLFLLVIENVGRTMARNVVIKFDKPLTTTIERPRELHEAALFREPIPSLPPGKKLRVPFDTLPARMENGLPLAYEVTLRYEGPSGRKYGEGEGYRLDMGVYEVVYAGPKGLPDLVAEVKKIRAEVEKWKGDIRGLLVQTVDQRRQHRIEARRRNVQILRRQGPMALARWLRDRALWRSRAPLGRSFTAPGRPILPSRTIRTNMPHGHAEQGDSAGTPRFRRQCRVRTSSHLSRRSESIRRPGWAG